jgi:hypothetical protein
VGGPDRADIAGAGVLIDAAAWPGLIGADRLRGIADAAHLESAWPRHRTTAQDMETAARQLQTKFEAARAFFEKAREAAPEVARAQAASWRTLLRELAVRAEGGGPATDLVPHAEALQAELAALEVRFALASGRLYLQAASGETGRLAAQAEFARILAAEDFAGEADRLVARGEAAVRAAGVPLRAAEGAAPGLPPARPARPPACGAAAHLQRLLDVYPRGRPATGPPPTRLTYERCPACGGEMAVDAGRSELVCAECGALRELVGTVFEDAQFYNQEGQKAKSGTFNPNRHFQFWWAHILARELEEEIGDREDAENLYGEKLLGALRALVARDRKLLRLLTVNDVRAMLRELGRTDLNKNVPLLLKKLTGVGPPQLPDAIAARVENLFTKAIEAGERVRRGGRVNRNYYPFYIRRILEQLLPEDDYEARRVLYYIYVQSKETVEADDADWQLICRELPELEYRPTDRFLGFEYGPAPAGRRNAAGSRR